MKVVLYGSETCGKCKILKKRLDEASVQYDEQYDPDIVENAIGDNRIPVLCVDGEMLNFSRSIVWIKEMAN